MLICDEAVNRRCRKAESRSYGSGCGRDPEQKPFQALRLGSCVLDATVAWCLATPE
jgi:hypothetical protein